MGRLSNLLLQKFLPSAKKSIWVDVRRKNGAWTSQLLPPGTKSFKIKDSIYYLKGLPEIEDATNQRKYVFLQGIPYPIGFDASHESLLKLNADFGNIEMLLTEADEQGFQRAMLLKAHKGLDPLTIIMILTGLTLLVSLLILWFAYNNAELLGQLARVAAGGA